MSTLILWMAFIFILIETFLFIYLTYLIQQNNLLTKSLTKKDWSNRCSDL